MLCLMLERMELSQGFNNLEKRTNRPHTSKITLLPRRQVIENLTAAKTRVAGGKESAVASVLQQAQPFTSKNMRPAGEGMSGSPDAPHLSSRPPNSNTAKIKSRPTSAAASGLVPAGANAKEDGHK